MSSVGSLCWRLMLISMLAVGIMSCSATRKAIRGPIKVHGDEYLMGKMKEHELKFKNFSAKFSATYETGRKSTSVSGSLRIENDSIIWISVTPALGIEAIRFMLTPDSIKYLNRLNSTYLSQPFTYINQLLNKTLDYDMAQSFLLGNDFSLYESNKFKATIDNDQYKLNTENRRKLRRFVRRSQDDISIPIQTIWLDPESFKITKVMLNEAVRDSRQFLASYSEFETVDSKTIPSNLDFRVETVDKKVRITIEYSKIQLDQDLTYPFRIPKSYTEIKDIQPEK